MLVRIAEYRSQIETLLEHSAAVDIGVAFATIGGIKFGHIENRLKQFLDSGGKLRVLLELRLGNTHPDFLEHILNLQDENKELVECRSFLLNADGVFHPKVYIFHMKNGSTTLVIGSANWTEQAFSVNIEYGYVVEGDITESLITETQDLFESWWSSSNAKAIDRKAVELYRTFWRRRQGLDKKARKKASSPWNRLQQHLAAVPGSHGFQWPSNDAALLMGALAARGKISDTSLSIRFTYGGQNYQHNGLKGYIGKGRVSYKALDVVDQVPSVVADRIRQVVLPSIPKVVKVGSWTFEIQVDCTENTNLISKIREFFPSSGDYKDFDVPQQIFKADKEVWEEFLRGYGLASGLVSSGTYTGDKQLVWLRPAMENLNQFDQMVDLIENKIGIKVYKHRRKDRDVAIKMNCESWMDIGFGVEWLDAIVEEGARLNDALEPSNIS